MEGEGARGGVRPPPPSPVPSLRRKEVHATLPRPSPHGQGSSPPSSFFLEEGQERGTPPAAPPSPHPERQGGTPPPSPPSPNPERGARPLFLPWQGGVHLPFSLRRRGLPPPSSPLFLEGGGGGGGGGGGSGGVRPPPSPPSPHPERGGTHPVPTPFPCGQVVPLGTEGRRSPLAEWRYPPLFLFAGRGRGRGVRLPLPFPLHLPMRREVHAPLPRRSP